MFELAAMCLAGMIDCAIHTDRPVAPVPQETAAEFYERRYRELHHKCKVERPDLLGRPGVFQTTTGEQ